jgi:hypothetical protein
MTTEQTALLAAVDLLSEALDRTARELAEVDRRLEVLEAPREGEYNQPEREQVAA